MGIWCWTFRLVLWKPIACAPKSFPEKIQLCTSKYEENGVIALRSIPTLLLRDQTPEVEQKDPEMSIQGEEPLDTNESFTQSTLEEGKDKETLISRFPKSMQNRVRSVLEYLRPQVTWNDKGEVSIRGQDIPGSNIVDLLKVNLKDYKDFNPVGKDAFRKVLCELNVPMSLLARSARQQSGRGYLPPPPGIPTKRREEVPVQRKVKWLRL